MNDKAKAVIRVLALIYFISPLDLCPGCLLDDFIVLAVAYFSADGQKVVRGIKEKLGRL